MPKLLGGALALLLVAAVATGSVTAVDAWRAAAERPRPCPPARGELQGDADLLTRAWRALTDRRAEALGDLDGSEFALARSCVLYAGRFGGAGDPRVVVVEETVAGYRVLVRIGELQVPERNFHRIRPQMKARVSPLANPSVVVEGEVAAVGGFIDPTTRTGEVEVVLPDAGERIVAGSAVSVEIELARRSGVLMVPVQAVQFAADVHESGDATVFVVVDGVAHARAVKVGHREPEAVEIVEGLKPGEVVATVGAHLLRDGALVSIEEPKR